MKDLKTLVMLAVLCLFACKKETIPFNELSLVDALENVIKPLSEKPLEWKDRDLTFLDELARKQIIGLGEATHGTKEFFQAKHRILQYMVENHDVKVFAIEADFGESIFINEAIQASRTTDIKRLMSEKMHFWTWRTQAVLEMLEWMSEYNKDQPEGEKLQYIGVDCQYNTYNPELVLQYLEKNEVVLANELRLILTQVANFDFNTPDKEIQAPILIDGIIEAIEKFENRRSDLIASSSALTYELFLRTLYVTRQVVENIGSSNELRDKYMAENTNWAAQHFGNKKVVCWAHNAHIATDDNYFGNQNGSKGHHLNRLIGRQYVAVGFTFNKGQFTAFGRKANDTYTGRIIHEYTKDPKKGSLNDVFGASKESAFMVNLAELCANSMWEKYLSDYPSLFSLGAVYLVDNPEHHYYRFYKEHFDYLIHFDTTSATEVLPQ